MSRATLTEEQRHGVELAQVQMPLQASSLEVLPVVVDGLLPLYGSDGYESARIAATSYIVGAALYLQFGPDAGEHAVETFSVFDPADFNTSIALMGYEDQRQLMGTATAIQ